MKKAVIIGAGFGGLALALRLQSAGIATTVIEARDRPGGHAYAWHKDGYIFDAGPSAVTDPDCLAQLWRLSGHDMAQDMTLLPVTPFHRLHWPDGSSFDHSGDEARLQSEVAKLSPTDIAGFRKFLEYSAAVCREGYERRGHVAFPDIRSMLKAAPDLAQYQAWRSVHSMVSGFVKNEKLRQALSFHTLLVGGNPMTASALHALIPRLEMQGGVWFPKGGVNALACAMVTHFERLGGTLHLGDPVARIETVGDRAAGVATRAGLRFEADAVASNADLMHSYADLLSEHGRGRSHALRLARKRWSPSLFLVHFGIEGSWPGIPHHMILFGPRYRELLTDIFDHGVLAQDLLISLSHPSVTDPDLAPPGHSTFRAAVPVPHLGKLPVDWSQIGPILENRILDEIERRFIPDIRSRIRVKFSYDPNNLSIDLHTYHGSAHSLEPLLGQSAWLRPHNRDDVIGNFYLVGAGTHPGAGIPGVVASAQATATLMLEELG